MLLIGCNIGNGDIGKDNAVKYVRAAIGNMEVQSIEVVASDSLLCDLPMMLERNALLRNVTAFLEESISADSLQRSIDKMYRYYNDIVNSWVYSAVVNDSLRNVGAYAGAWRRVHTIEVTMTGGKKEHTRVLMENDGTTARCIENEFIDILNEYTTDIEDAERYLRGW